VTDAPGDEARIGDIGRALAGSLRWRDLWAIGIAVVVAPLVSILLAVAVALITPWGDAWSSWPFRWLSLGDLAFGLLLVLLWQAASVLLVPAPLRGAMEVQTWAGERDLHAWQQAAGAMPWQLPPTTPGRAARWLAAHPETERNRGARIEVLLLARRFDEARAALARLPVASPTDRIAHADLAATQAFVERGELELEALRQATADAEGDDRLDGVVRVAMLEVRSALGAGGDWVTPLATARAALGSRADGVLWSGFFRRRVLLLAPLVLAATVGLGVIRSLGGG
jgi:hypothetical protein